MLNVGLIEPKEIINDCLNYAEETIFQLIPLRVLLDKY